jgi:hypothetical protein
VVETAAHRHPAHAWSRRLHPRVGDTGTRVLAGPELAHLVANRVGFGTAFEWTWRIVQWALVFALVASGIGLVYHFAPDVEQDSCG